MIARNTCGPEKDQAPSCCVVEEGMFIKATYVFFARIWPLMFIGFQVYYFFRKIEWEVCDAPEGGMTIGSFIHIDPMSAVRGQYMMWIILNGMISLQQLNLWFIRKFPISPSKDLERTIYREQVFQRMRGARFGVIWTVLITSMCLFSLYRVVHHGSLLDTQFVGLEACEREEPDLALLSNVNERFFLWRVLQHCFLSMYIRYGWGIANKECYRRLPDAQEYAPGSQERQRYKEELDDQCDRERATWGWFE